MFIERYPAALFVGIAASILLAGCQAFPYVMGFQPIPTEDAAPEVISLLRPSGSQSGQLMLGREVYINKCTECHKPMPIRSFTTENWTKQIMPVMSKRAKLTPDETQAVLAYVLAVKDNPVSKKVAPVAPPVPPKDNQ